MKKKEFKLSDRSLWNQFLSGDSQAFKLIYEKYVADLFRYGKRFSTDEELVKDCIQDLFIDLYHYRLKLSKIDRIMPYLMISLKRIILKKNKNEISKKYLINDILPFEYELEDDHSVEQDEKKIDVLQLAMNKLTDRQREAIYMKYVMGLSYEELAEVLNLNYQTSRNLIYRGMKKLRESINQTSVILFLLLGNLFLKKNDRKDNSISINGILFFK